MLPWYTGVVVVAAIGSVADVKGDCADDSCCGLLSVEPVAKDTVIDAVGIVAVATVAAVAAAADAVDLIGAAVVVNYCSDVSFAAAVVDGEYLAGTLDGGINEDGNGIADVDVYVHSSY